MDNTSDCSEAVYRQPFAKSYFLLFFNLYSSFISYHSAKGLACPQQKLFGKTSLTIRKCAFQLFSPCKVPSRVKIKQIMELKISIHVRNCLYDLQYLRKCWCKLIFFDEIRPLLALNWTLSQKSIHVFRYFLAHSNLTWNW